MTVEVRKSKIYVQDSAGRMQEAGRLKNRTFTVHREVGELDGKYWGYRVPMDVIKSSQFCDTVQILVVAQDGRLLHNYRIARNKAFECGSIVSLSRREFVIPTKFLTPSTAKV